MINEPHIKQTNNFYQVIFKRYKIDRSFSRLEDAIKFRDEVESNITKQELKKIVDKDYKFMYPNNVLDIIYGSVKDEEFKKLDFAWIHDNAPYNILYVLTRISESANEQKNCDMFMQHVTGSSFETIAQKYGISRQRVQQIFVTVLDKVVAYKNYILYPTFYNEYSQLELEYKVRYSNLMEKISMLNEGKVVADESLEVDEDIEILDLSTRSQHCLGNAGYKKISELLLLSDEQFMSIRGFGKKCLKEVKGKISSFRYIVEG